MKAAIAEETQTTKPRLSAFSGAASQQLETEADHAAAQALRRGTVSTGGMLSPPMGCGCQGSCGCAKGVQPFLLSAIVSGIGALVSLAAQATSEAVIVDDSVTPATGQVTRAGFLASARSRVCVAADEELVAVGRDSEGCPYIQHWFARVQGKSATELERLVALYAQPSDRSVEGYLSALEQRVRASVQTWISSGDIDDIEAGGSATLGSMDVQLKADDSGAPRRPGSGSPEHVRSQLGPGRPFEGGIRHRMEAGFGESFARVRVHTDATAARIATDHRAVALTVGNDIIMGPGAWRPGTLGGDALIAHELAHTVQQRGGSTQAAGTQHEGDADRAAAAVLMGGRAQPMERSGLAVQGCRPTVKQCPPGMRWGRVANAQALGAGSLGCSCNYRCIPDEAYASRGPILCPAGGCRPVEIVGTDYHFNFEGEVQTAPVADRAGLDQVARGWGGQATPLGAPAACLCPGVNIQGERIEGAHMTAVAMDLTDIAPGPRNRQTGIIQPGGRRPGAGRQHGAPTHRVVDGPNVLRLPGGPSRPTPAPGGVRVPPAVDSAPTPPRSVIYDASGRPANQAPSPAPALIGPNGAPIRPDPSAPTPVLYGPDNRPLNAAPAPTPRIVIVQDYGSVRPPAPTPQHVPLANFDAPPAFGQVRPRNLAPLPSGWRWTRRGDLWVPAAPTGQTPGAGRVILHSAPDGPVQVLFFLDGRLVSSNVTALSRGSMNPAGTTRGQMPALNLTDPLGRPLDRGHVIDYEDTLANPLGLNSNRDPRNYTAELRWWNRWGRNPLVQGLRDSPDTGYGQFMIYGDTPLMAQQGFQSRVSRSAGIGPVDYPIPQAQVFFTREADGSLRESYQIPFDMSFPGGGYRSWLTDPALRPDAAPTIVIDPSYQNFTPPTPE